MKILLITMAFILSKVLLSQDIGGHYTDGEQLLKLNPDSSVQFQLYIDRDDNIYTLRTGFGKWTVKNGFLIIDIQNSKKPYFEVKDGPSETIEIYDFKGETVPFAKAIFYEKGDSVGWRVSELNGTIEIENVETDSIQIKAAESTPIGFKVDKEKKYHVYIESFSFVNTGQMAFKITSIDKGKLTLKHLEYSSTKSKINNKYIRRLKIQSLFTTGSINYDEFKLKK